ncbi:methyltransferase [Neobacillus sp. PS3-34]|uniref:methyltransferase n=1 Tax=Neobacillus sp. PS3-34 TaxID=3070678 RepID=UPI0027DFCC62|nr:methyltransferase [Neobacillus sp. PS3-34]WML49853.1 methyltransferase [Neobacillus sp. PS3-34]
MKEQFYDEMLNIKTRGDQKGFNKTLHYHRYEPTPYSALEQLFAQYELKSSDRIVDFGCGKGRLNFYINYLYNTTSIGVEMNEAFYQEALKNRTSYLNKYRKGHHNIHFHCCLAQEYPIDVSDNRFYFFNPFSIQIFMNIINNILISVEKSVRDVELVLYYPSEDYIFFLENQTSIELKQEIMLPGLYEHNSFERFSIYRLA